MDSAALQLARLVDEDGRNVAVRLAEAEGISRQAASARLKKLVHAGVLACEGHGAGVRYALAVHAQTQQAYARNGLSEDRVWTSQLAPLVAALPENVRDIWRYGMTEMINNAIDHSGATTVRVGMRQTALATEAFVADDGEGIFLRIQRALDLFDPRESMLELAKGKFTTDPDRHSGEGIFFTSKVFDVFQITSGGLLFAHADGQADTLSEHVSAGPGTAIRLRLANDSGRTTKSVFDQFALPEEFTFARTVVPVRLAQHEGEKLVSRSQAKRLTMRFERFQTVVLDFAGVGEIGQAFADEVFRVFQAGHPQTQLTPINMTADVQAMVGRALSRRD